MKHLSEKEKALLRSEQVVEQVRTDLYYIYENNLDEFVNIAEIIRDSFQSKPMELPNLTKDEETLIIKLAYYGCCVIAARAIGREV